MDGHLTDKIHLEQGVPQGDIISPYIFIIAVEILLIKITKSKNIQGVKIGKKECKAQTFADDTTILIKRDEASLRASILYIEEFKLISGLAANLDKTNVIPYGKFFNPGQKICPDLDVNWVDNFKLLGIEIDNKLEKLNINFDKALAKAQNIISNWKARKLPINGRIIISKSLIVSQFNYVASILTPPTAMLSKMQALINNFIRGGDHHWISDDKLYAPIKSGGLNCIELDSFFKGLKTNWIKRYIFHGYDDFWTDILDEVLGVNINTRKNILLYGSEYFNSIIQQDWESDQLKELILTLQELLREFVTDPETGDNRFITQSVFFNKNITCNYRGRKRKFLNPTMYGWPRDFLLSVKNVYNLHRFITYDEFKVIYNQQFNGFPAESSFLKLKADISSIFGPINKNKKYPPPVPNKAVPKWIFQTPVELFEKTRRGSKNYRFIFRQHKIKHFQTTWDKALDDVTITNAEVNQKLNWLSNSELSQDIIDRAQRFIYRKTQFNDQLCKYAKSGVTSNICSYCFLTEKYK